MQLSEQQFKLPPEKTITQCCGRGQIFCIPSKVQTFVRFRDGASLGQVGTRVVANYNLCAWCRQTTGQFCRLLWILFWNINRCEIDRSTSPWPPPCPPKTPEMKISRRVSIISDYKRISNRFNISRFRCLPLFAVKINLPNKVYYCSWWGTEFQFLVTVLTKSNLEVCYLHIYVR